MQAEDIRDIKPPVNFAGDNLLFIIIGALILLLALIALAVFLKKRLKKGPKKEPLPAKPAHQIAYEALQALKAKNLPAKGEIKQYYIELSNIVRHYLENRFRLRAPEMTTEEFLYSLQESDSLSGAQKNLLKQFLGHCDLVKFARYGPTQKEIENSFNAAEKLVEETKDLEPEGERKEVPVG